MAGGNDTLALKVGVKKTVIARKIDKSSKCNKCGPKDPVPFLRRMCEFLHYICSVRQKLSPPFQKYRWVYFTPHSSYDLQFKKYNDHRKKPQQKITHLIPTSLIIGLVLVKHAHPTQIPHKLLIPCSECLVIFVILENAQVLRFINIIWLPLC